MPHALARGHRSGDQVGLQVLCCGTAAIAAKTAADVTSTAVSPNGSVVSLNPSATDAITCTITPAQGNTLDPTKTYVYDVSVTKDSGATVYTLLTGNITIIDDVAVP